MGRFYLDMEFTNDNYYLADIIEIALAAEDNGNTFHNYTRIHYSIPKRVKELTNITDKTLATIGCSFKDTWFHLSNLYIMNNCRARQIQLLSRAVDIHMISQFYSQTI